MPAGEAGEASEEGTLRAFTRMRAPLRSLLQAYQAKCKEKPEGQQVLSELEFWDLVENERTLKHVFTCLEACFGKHRGANAQQRTLRLCMGILEQVGRANSQKYDAGHTTRGIFLYLRGLSRPGLEMLHANFLCSSYNTILETLKKLAREEEQLAPTRAAQGITVVRLDNSVFKCSVNQTTLNRAYVLSDNATAVAKSLSDTMPQFIPATRHPETGEVINPTQARGGFSLDLLKEDGVLHHIYDDLRRVWDPARPQRCFLDELKALRASRPPRSNEQMKRELGYDELELRLALDGLLGTFPVKLLAGHNPNGFDAVSNAAQFVDDEVFKDLHPGKDALRILVGDVGICAPLRASMLDPLLFIFSDLFHLLFVKPGEQFQESYWEAVLGELLKAIGKSVNSYRSSDVYDRVAVLRELVQAYEEHELDSALREAFGALEAAEAAKSMEPPRLQSIRDQLTALHTLCTVYAPLALIAEELYSCMMNASDVAVRRAAFIQYEKQLPIWGTLHLQAGRMNYAKECFHEAMVLRTLREANHPVWVAISANPWLVSQRDVELYNKRMQGYSSNNNFKLETDLLR